MTSVSVSADGRFVAFWSVATNLVENDTNGRHDVFVHDHKTGETTRVSVNSDGIEGNSLSREPSISNNGRFVTFASSATNLVSDDSSFTQDIFVHDRKTGETTRLSVNDSGAETNGPSFIPTISGNGHFVAFESWSTNLVDGDTNSFPDIFVANRKNASATNQP